MARPRPHKLELYQHAVQHPEAEVAFLLRAFSHYFGEAPATRLREDFAGTGAIAAAWVELGDDMRALAVEHDAATARWATRRHARRLGERAADLHVVHADAFDLATPRVDIVAATNFSAFIWHDRPAMLRYLRHARRCLRRPGLFVMDAFGGPGAMRLGEQTRPVNPPADAGLPPFDYVWEQRRFDHVTHRIDCRIHFRGLRGADTAPRRGRAASRENAFRYDWRLWTLPELLELLQEAGFACCDAWCDTPDAPGRYRPLRRLPAREDWVAYVVGAAAAR